MAWGKIFEFPKVLLVDGEKGIDNKEMIEWAKTKSMTIRTLPKGAHARMVERRQATMRYVMHKTEDQAKREGVTLEFDILCAEACFARNALTNVGGATPYNARFGRQPSMLPDILAPPENGTNKLMGRFSYRIREIAIQRMVEATATQRINRAMNTITKLAGQEYQFEPGELIEYWKESPQKDRSCCGQTNQPPSSGLSLTRGRWWLNQLAVTNSTYPFKGFGIGYRPSPACSKTTFSQTPRRANR